MPKLLILQHSPTILLALFMLWVQASTTKQMATVLFWFTTQRVVVISYRRFGTTSRSHLQGSRIKIRWDEYVFPKRLWEINTTCRVVTQKSAVLSCFYVVIFSCITLINMNTCAVFSIFTSCLPSFLSSFLLLIYRTSFFAAYVCIMPKHLPS